MEKLSAADIYSEYLEGVRYNQALNLPESIKKCENFYAGRQWEGLDAPDLPKPVINVLKRVVSYFISMIVSDDIAAGFTPLMRSTEADTAAKLLKAQVEQVIETADLKVLSREVVRDAAVCGDGALYFYFDPYAPSGQAVSGRIRAELIDNQCITVSNPASFDIDGQEYIIISMRRTVERVRREAYRAGASEMVISAITPDSEPDLYDPSDGAGDRDLCTVLIKFFRRGEKIFAIKSTKNVILRPCWDTGYTRYPVALMRWERMKNSFHGNSALCAMIPNQIAINQLFAMAIHHVKTMAFPKVIYDATRISKWTNKVGAAIGTVGNPNDAVATGFRAPDMSGQVLDLIENLTQKTLEFMGASDATLGNIKPDNTSAIIATQKSSAMPLELQRMEYMRFTEEYIRILIDMIRADYGVRECVLEENGGARTMRYDFGKLPVDNLTLNVDVGSAAYWSEVMQVQTLDNLFSKGIITDAVTYLEGIPDRYIHGKGKLIEDLKRKQQEQVAMQQSGAGMQGADTAPFGQQAMSDMRGV